MFPQYQGTYPDLNSDYSPVIAIILVFCALLWLWAILDVSNRKFDDRFDQIVWLLLIICLQCVGAGLYFLFARSESAYGRTSFRPNLGSHPVILASFPTQVQAELARSILEAQNIVSYLNWTGGYVPIGGDDVDILTSLVVSSGDAEMAASILANDEDLEAVLAENQTVIKDAVTDEDVDETPHSSELVKIAEYPDKRTAVFAHRILSLNEIESFVLLQKASSKGSEAGFLVGVAVQARDESRAVEILNVEDASVEQN